MKRLLSAILISACFGSAYADDTAANIQIKISGAMHDNRYFLCLPNVGCLSILGAQRGKVFPVFHEVNMDNIYVADASRGLQVSPQGLPASCNATVSLKQTVTISGSIAQERNGMVKINNLRCSIS